VLSGIPFLDELQETKSVELSAAELCSVPQCFRRNSQMHAHPGPSQRKNLQFPRGGRLYIFRQNLPQRQNRFFIKKLQRFITEACVRYEAAAGISCDTGVIQRKTAGMCASREACNELEPMQ
jgi:hypothetical protein